MVGKLMLFIKDEDGTTAIEYGLIAGLICLAVIGSMTIVGNGLLTVFGTTETGVGGVLTDATASMQ